MAKLSRAEETILRNQLCIMSMMQEVHGPKTHSLVVNWMQRRIGYTEQFVKDNGNGIE